MSFLAALLVAAGYRLCTEATGLWYALTDSQQQVDAALKQRRLEVCRKCPIFYKPLQTCGSPLAKDSSMGCHCHMPKAAGVFHNCWAWENGWLPFDGWPAELNSSWLLEHESSKN